MYLKDWETLACNDNVVCKGTVTGFHQQHYGHRMEEELQAIWITISCFGIGLLINRPLPQKEQLHVLFSLNLPIVYNNTISEQLEMGLL